MKPQRTHRESLVAFKDGNERDLGVNDTETDSSLPILDYGRHTLMPNKRLSHKSQR